MSVTTGKVIKNASGPSPNPTWKPGDKLPCPEKMLSFDPKGMETRDVYKLLIGTVVPRPIAFVSTVSPDGVVNLAPFSFFNGVSSNPPAVVVSVVRKRDGSPKDTMTNIEKTKQFVVNSVNEWMIEPVNQTSAEYPYGVDEMEKVGLTPVESEVVKPPRVKESAWQMECELYDTMEVGDGSPGSSTLVVGRVVRWHVAADAYEDGRIKIEALKPIARLGGAAYGRTSGIFEIPRPQVER